MLFKINQNQTICLVVLLFSLVLQSCTRLGREEAWVLREPSGFTMPKRSTIDDSVFESFDTSIVAKGVNLYSKNCKLCHGDITEFGFSYKNINVMQAAFKDAVDEVSYMNKFRGQFSDADIKAISGAIIAAVYPDLVQGVVVGKEAVTLAEKCEKHSPAVAGKTHYRRLNKREFLNSVRDIFKDQNIQVSDFAQDYSSHDGFDGVDGVLSTSEINTQKILSAAESVAEQVVGRAGFNVCAGVATNNNRSALNWIEAEAFNANQGGQVENDPAGNNQLLGYLTNGNYFLYRAVDFASGVKSVHMLLSTENQYAGMGVEVRVDSLTGPLLGTVTMSGTGAWYNFQRQAVNVNSVTGVRDVYLIVRSTPTTSGNIDAFRFSTATADVAVTGKTTIQMPTSARACIEKYLTDVLKMAYRNRITTSDITPLVDLAMTQTNNNEGLKSALLAVLASPRFLMHVVDYSKGIQGAVHTLDQYELASRLSFMLWQSVPDQELLTLAESNQLQNTAVLNSQIDRMMADSKFSRFTTTFPAQWLEYSHLSGVQLSASAFPEFTEAFKNSSLKEAELVVSGMIRENAPLAELFTGTTTYVDPTLAQFYGLGYPSGATGFQKVQLDTNTRRGLLTQAAVMTASATTGTNKTIRRGVMMLRKVLCQSLGAPPPGIPALPTQNQGRTLSVRESLAQHRTNKTCATCHNHIDPIGLAYENYSTTGRFMASVNGATVDPSGTTGLGKNFSSAIDLGFLFATDVNTEMCAAKFIQTFGLGRELNDKDQCNAAAIARLTKQRSGSVTLKQLIKDIITHESFTKSLLSQ